ncbi:hypothetical protein [Photobacterium lipolyticum]|uniref:Uncharacterized protein n=1 Tax=Photobacterium lipolyticum TaxID=266810 RepID=A0A2T3MTY6_9GAMM|nr:hypothetical protein [Photobacterium lipolyticum]PSW03426.1 hypothetical protein C9I89_18185 [Photobacterium lipolyticum]
MAKSLCKYRRVEIAAQIAAITRIVSAPEYICSSCARVASDQAYLCKPSAMSSKKRVQSANVRPAKSASEDDPIQSIQSLAPVKPHAVEGVTLGKKKTRKLKKLAKKKAKKLKQATKALKRYNAALGKVDVE